MKLNKKHLLIAVIILFFFNIIIFIGGTIYDSPEDKPYVIFIYKSPSIQNIELSSNYKEALKDNYNLMLIGPDFVDNETVSQYISKYNVKSSAEILLVGKNGTIYKRLTPPENGELLLKKIK